jgi:AcrR family transcriptional regulator
MAACRNWRCPIPRIKAASIDEHVREQTARILGAAAELFRVRGYRKTDMEDIAQSVGLARNSLYRYYGNKDAILLACVQRDMGAYVEEMRNLERLYPDAAERVHAWLDMQVDIATSPAHATLELIAEIRNVAPKLRKQLLELHEAPAAALAGAVSELYRGKRRDVALHTALIRGMAEAAATQAMQRDNHAMIKRELRRAVTRVLDT